MLYSLSQNARATGTIFGVWDDSPTETPSQGLKYKILFNFPHYFLTVIKQLNGGYLLQPETGTYEVTGRLIILNPTG